MFIFYSCNFKRSILFIFVWYFQINNLCRRLYGRYLLVDSTMRLTINNSYNIFQLVPNSAAFLLHFISTNQSESIHHFRKTPQLTWTVLNVAVPLLMVDMPRVQDNKGYWRYVRTCQWSSEIDKVFREPSLTLINWGLPVLSANVNQYSNSI